MASPSNGAEQSAKLPIVTVTFHPDGNMELHADRVGPPQLWAAARLIELWGDSEFTAQQITLQEKGKRGGLVTPTPMRRIGS